MARGLKAATAAGPVEGPWALPDGWRWERLGQIVPLTYGKALKASERDSTGSVPVYGSSGPVGLHAEALCTEPALIVGRKGAAGCVHFCDGPTYVIDTAYFAPASKLSMDIRLANHLLNHLQLSALDQSTAVPSLSRDTYNDVIAPLPPQALQGSLAAKIDALFAEVAAGEEALAAVKSSLGQWRQALLKAAVTGELTADWRAANPPAETGEALLARVLADRRTRSSQDPRNKGKRYPEPPPPDTADLPTLPDGWTWASLAQLSFVVGGVTVDGKRKPADPVTAPYLRVANVQRGHLALEQLKTITVERSVAEQLVLLPGDMLLNEGGDRDKIGRGWVFAGEVEGCLHQNHVFRARPASPLVSPMLCMSYLNELGRDFFIQQGKQTTNLASISLSKVSTAPIPVPPAAEAEVIMRMVEQLEAEQAALLGIASEANDRASSLRQSILAIAFRGDLAA